jgi:c-di-GMP-binding flagellar brake protein YcgR
MSFDGRERRLFVRLTKTIPVRFIILSKTKEPLSGWISANSKNMSIGGILLETADINQEEKNLLKKEDIYLQIEISLEASDLSMKGKVESISSIELPGRIQWSKPQINRIEIGIQFIDISDETADKIKKYLTLEYIGKYKN